MFKSIHNNTAINFRGLCVSIAWIFLFMGIIPAAQAQKNPTAAQPVVGLPAVGRMVELTPSFAPPLIKGVNIHPDDPLKLDFIIGRGDDNLTGSAFENESQKLIKYFLAALTVPEEQMWVNLSPYEKNRIIPESFGATEMGRDLLAQDYLLKQLTASLMYPEKKLGKKFWDEIYQRAYAEYGTTEIPVDTFNKVWIVPESATVYEHAKGAFVVDHHLKVLFEEDYLALETSFSAVPEASRQNEILSNPKKSKIAKEVIREIIIPAIEREVNEGETFANLRQIYNSVILATWYKKALRNSLLGQVYVDQSKTRGIETDDPQMSQKIYNQYIEAFKTGVYNYIKEDYDTAKDEMVLRQYFSGGASLEETGSATTVVGTAADLTQKEIIAASENSEIVETKFSPIDSLPSPGPVDPHLNYNDPFGRYLQLWLNGYATNGDDRFHISPESIARRNILLETGPRIENFIRTTFQNSDIRIALFPRGSTLDGSAGTNSDVEFDLVILQGLPDEGHIIGINDHQEQTKAIYLEMQRLVSETSDGRVILDGHALATSDYVISNLSQETFHFDPARLYPVAQIFSPVVYGDPDLVETIRSKAMASIRSTSNSENLWKEVQRIQLAMNLGLHIKRSDDKTRWLREHGINNREDYLSLNTFVIKRLLSLSLPDWERMLESFPERKKAEASIQDLVEKNRAGGDGGTTKEKVSEDSPSLEKMVYKERTVENILESIRLEFDFTKMIWRRVSNISPVMLPITEEQFTSKNLAPMFMPIIEDYAERLHLSLEEYGRLITGQDSYGLAPHIRSEQRDKLRNALGVHKFEPSSGTTFFWGKAEDWQFLKDSVRERLKTRWENQELSFSAVHVSGFMGTEAYSVAIVIHEALENLYIDLVSQGILIDSDSDYVRKVMAGEETAAFKKWIKKWNINIDNFDVNITNLAFVQQAIYLRRVIPDKFPRKFLKPYKHGNFVQIVQRLRDWVHPLYIDLINDEQFKLLQGRNYDVKFLVNTLGHLPKHLQWKVMQALYPSMTKHPGILFYNHLEKTLMSLGVKEGGDIVLSDHMTERRAEWIEMLANNDPQNEPAEILLLLLPIMSREVLDQNMQDFVQAAIKEAHLEDNTIVADMFAAALKRRAFLAGNPGGAPFSASPGGIDLNSQTMDWNVAQSEGLRVNFSSAMPVQIEEFQNVQGIVPTIIHVTPATNLPVLLGIRNR